MANDILSSFLSKTAFSIKNSENGTIAIPELKIVAVSIKLESTAMHHMQEDGSTVVDSRIIQATTMSIRAFCPNESTQRQLQTLSVDRENLYSSYSKGITLANMMVEGVQIMQNADVLSAAPVVISLKQIPNKTTKPATTKNSSDSSLINRGMTILSAAKTSLEGLSSKVKGFF